jgi:hypothetical protein
MHVNQFRRLEKRRSVVSLPVPVDDRLRAVRGRLSLSECCSAALCSFLGLDPAPFGLDAVVAIPPVSPPALPGDPFHRSSDADGLPSRTQAALAATTPTYADSISVVQPTGDTVARHAQGPALPDAGAALTTVPDAGGNSAAGSMARRIESSLNKEVSE